MRTYKAASWLWIKERCIFCLTFKITFLPRRLSWGFQCVKHLLRFCWASFINGGKRWQLTSIFMQNVVKLGKPKYFYQPLPTQNYKSSQSFCTGPLVAYGHVFSFSNHEIKAKQRNQEQMLLRSYWVFVELIIQMTIDPCQTCHRCNLLELYWACSYCSVRDLEGSL